MRRRDYRYGWDYSRERRKAPIKLVRRLTILALVGITIYTLGMVIFGRPRVVNLEDWKLLPGKGEKVLTLEGKVREAQIKLIQGDKSHTLASLPLQDNQRSLVIPVDTLSAGFRDGPAKLRIDLKSGFLASRSYEVDALVDTKAPRVELIAFTNHVRQGSSFAIKVRTDEVASLYLKMGEEEYKLYTSEDGYYLGILPVKVDAPPTMSLELVAKDRAGNVGVRRLTLSVKQVKFKEEKINVSDRLIQEVIMPLLGNTTSLTPEGAFLKVNEGWRKENLAKLFEMGRKSEPRKLWDGAFIQLPNSKVISTYGDIRHYYYSGKHISISRHLGYDFASIERAPVPASNGGVVVFTGELGIYGSTVIIDHGLGVMSLYGHLSQIDVKEGQYVKKGETVGRTGRTGLALGDHLHFGILVQGYEVNPLEWMDRMWIANNVESVLKAR